MIVYHGSDVKVEKPKLIKSMRMLDFGPGFYTTANRVQAVSFARKVMLRNGSDTEYVSAYEADMKKITTCLWTRVLRHSRRSGLQAMPRHRHWRR